MDLAGARTVRARTSFQELKNAYSIKNLGSALHFRGGDTCHFECLRDFLAGGAANGYVHINLRWLLLMEAI